MIEGGVGASGIMKRRDLCGVGGRLRVELRLLWTIEEAPSGKGARGATV